MQLLGGFASIASLETLLLMLVGTFGGLIIGALPGLSAFTALAIMLPFTFGMNPISGLCFLVSVYVGGSSGGLISAVLLGIPGTPSSIATCFDGYPMAQQGKSKTALSAAIIASETANNATVGGAMIILLTLGIPGDNATSIILAGFQMNDIAPGPLLFKTQGELVYAILAGFVVANILFFVMEYFGLSIFTKMLSIPSMLLLPIVIVCCFVGSYCANNNTLDIFIMVVFGIIGYILKEHEFPLAPMVVGFILAPMLELYLRRSLMKTDGQWLPIISSPIAAICIFATVFTIGYSIYKAVKKPAAAAQ